MQSFSFKSDYDENRNIERIIKERNRKLAKQQIIFTIVLIVVLTLLGIYIFRKIVYTEFDGYVQTEYKDYRAVEDMYIFDQYTAVGDIVIPGDTLYSFVYINLFGLDKMSSEPGVILNDRNARLQVNMAYADAEVLRVRIHELEKQIEREDNNIRFGLTDNSHKMDLQRQLAETREQLNATMKKAGLYGNIRRESQSAVHRFGQYSLDFANEQGGLDYVLSQVYERNSSAVRYEIAQDTALVTKLWATPFSRVFKQEHILQLENLSLEDSNMQVVAYVPTHKMSRVNNNTQAEVIVNNDVRFRATVELLGARTEELPDELRNSLSHTYTSVMVVLSPDRDQILPLWAAVDRIPVKVRIKNYDNGRRNDGSDYWYITRDGLTEESKYYLGMLRSHRTSSKYHYNPNSDAPNSGEEQSASKSADAAKSSTASSDTTKNRHNAADNENKYIRHTVTKNETLYSISKQYGVSVDDIIKLNPKAAKSLYVNDIILIEKK